MAASEVRSSARLAPRSVIRAVTGVPRPERALEQLPLDAVDSVEAALERDRRTREQSAALVRKA